MLRKKSIEKTRSPLQRTITSTFLSRDHAPPSTRSVDGNGDAKLGISAKNVSLSDFLNRSLHGKSIIPNAHQVKLGESLLLPSHGNVRETLSNTIKVQERNNDVIEESIFKQFNRANVGQEDSECLTNASVVNEVKAPVTNDAILNLRKRKIPSRGGNVNYPARSGLVVLGDDSQKENINCVNQQDKRSKIAHDPGESNRNHKKHVVVLGDDPKPRRRPRGRSSFREEQRTAYNHYENGVGWWDNEREGIDNGDVAFNEGWEVKGSSSLGGLFVWH